MLVIPAAPQRAAHRPHWCEQEESLLCSPGAGRGRALAEWDLKQGSWPESLLQTNAWRPPDLSPQPMCHMVRVPTLSSGLPGGLFWSRACVPNMPPPATSVDQIELVGQ